ncbi:hypothetical protein PTSG_06651 [Salpingoeca rosetta]|uniref:Digestive organ expansion factor n=1 Tax=Salpingoeca rosetta (strain ATCC 50818 / BSB-021) TaxID=946362 RepID=F2UFL4_SALR5|nr:uncharacterized protein PTSG_06651 [Salpingoeca rosetta]EGD75582.1 hypothetical protein PTSG_06651 [Salpingoeca rosetta]|eukprot:XP_004992039.1 hypothetical protein PTSG_06651 [Salpingoeca rosetta]
MAKKTRKSAATKQKQQQKRKKKEEEEQGSDSGGDDFVLGLLRDDVEGDEVLGSSSGEDEAEASGDDEGSKAGAVADDGVDDDDDVDMDAMMKELSTPKRKSSQAAKALKTKTKKAKTASTATTPEHARKKAKKTKKTKKTKMLLDDDDDHDADDAGDVADDGNKHDELGAGDGTATPAKSKAKTPTKQKQKQKQKKSTTKAEATDTASKADSIAGSTTTTNSSGDARKHPMLRAGDACDMTRFDARYIAYNEEERLPELRRAETGAKARRFGQEQPCPGMPPYLERTCPPELPDMLVTPASVQAIIERKASKGKKGKAKGQVATSDTASSTTIADASSSSSIADAVKYTNETLRERVHPRLALPRDSMKPLQSYLFETFDSYRDVLFTERTFKHAKYIREAYVLHVLNHLFKSRAYVLRHNELLQSSTLEDEDVCRDQGYARAKALILVPYREHALHIVKLIAKMACAPTAAGKPRDLRHRKKFMEEYRVEEAGGPRHPNEEYRQYFTGNVDDLFVLGVALKKLSVQLYSSFNTSDLIIASPLGLKHALEKRKESNESNFLSGVEVVVLDQAESFHMQNIDHLMWVFSKLNAKTLSGDVDIARIRYWALQNLSRCMRQTIAISSLSTPQLMSLFHRHCNNAAGRVMITKPYLGTIRQVVHQSLSQVFLRVHSDTYAGLPDARFNYFVRHVLPLLDREEAERTIIFIPSYFDYVRVRNHMHKQGMNFTQICEYTPQADVKRARSTFFHAHVSLMLYTERYHYHNRPTIRNARHLVFYELPLFPQFYSEMLNAINGAVVADATCTVLYSRFEADRLSRVVGTQQAISMLQSAEAKHLFM